MTYWAAGISGVVSGVLGSVGSSKAAKEQRRAAAEAAAIKARAYEEAKRLQTPFYDAGTSALDQLMNRLPDLTTGYDPERLLSEPGYEFARSEGQRGLEQSLAARGRNVSGGALERASRFNTDYATTKLNDAFNRDRTTRRDIFDMLTGLSSNGQRAAEGITSAGNAYAGNVGQDIYGRANAGAANSIAQANIWGDLLNQGASIWNTYSGKKTGGGADMGDMGINTGSLTDEQRRLRYFADGGAVPKVGTRAPRREGGGGGAMSREAVLAALGPPLLVTGPDGVAALPADPVRQPKVIVEDRGRKAGAFAEGGPVKGKSGGKADKVTAHLSGGEHVIDAEVVAMLGDGNTEAGHELLEDLKRRVRAYKREAPPGKPARSMAE